MLQCFRIYTEDINKETILKEAQKRFPLGFTVLTGIGCWTDAQEASLIIEIILESQARPSIQRLATYIKSLNKQDAVLITQTALSFSELV